MKHIHALFKIFETCIKILVGQIILELLTKMYGNYCFDQEKSSLLTFHCHFSDDLLEDSYISFQKSVGYFKVVHQTC